MYKKDNDSAGEKKRKEEKRARERERLNGIFDDDYSSIPRLAPSAENFVFELMKLGCLQKAIIIIIILIILLLLNKSILTNNCNLMIRITNTIN